MGEQTAGPVPTGSAASGSAASGSASSSPAASSPASSGPVPTGRPAARGRQVGMDMVRSLGLVAVLLGIWMWFAHPRTPEAINEVPWWQSAQSAAEVAGYEVLAPPEGFAWTATSARVEPQPDGTIVWRVGYYTPAEEYAAVLQRGVFPGQAQGSVEDWLAGESRNGRGDQTVTLAGRAWVRLEGEATPDERRSLVNVEQGTATVVTGSAAWDELEMLAGSLRPIGE